MKLLLPACGNSSRYPNLPPKWSLSTPKGVPMIYEAIQGLKVDPADIIIGILRKHEDALGAKEGIHRMLGNEVTVLIFEEPTRSQSETVFKMLEMAKIQEPFLIKDSDNVFYIDDKIEEEFNYICVERLDNFAEINAANKSYVTIDNNIVNCIKEKVVISNLFCVGGYYFTNPEVFCETYRKLVNQFVEKAKELYISDIIGTMLLDDILFFTKTVRGYEDWGTLKEWQKLHKAFKTYLVNLDGVVFSCGSPFFYPTYRDVKPNLDIVAQLIKLQQQGNKMIFISERDESWRQETEAALAELGFQSFKLIMECRNFQHILINAFSPQVPYPSAKAINLSERENQIEFML